jgi:hypothetical protein
MIVMASFCLAGCGSSTRPSQHQVEQTRPVEKRSCAQQTQSLVAAAKRRGATLTARERRLLRQAVKASKVKGTTMLCNGGVDAANFSATP